MVKGTLVPRKKKTVITEDREQKRILAESDLEEFIKLVHPKRVLGNIHRRIIRWWCREEAKKYQLLLLPRDHMKSTLLAYRLAWELTKDPTLRILLISSTSTLAVKQLKFIKDILTCANYRAHWPEMVNEEEAKRELWNAREIAVDHPKRKEWNIRDASIFTAGLNGNITGLHCDIAALDDVVVQGNAYTEEGREKVREQYSYLTSVETTGAKEWVVGTRYHPNDLYSDLLGMEIEEFDADGNVDRRTELFEVIQEQVESIGDGTGEFLWPRQQGSEGKWFGFDAKILADKKLKYLNKTHFRAQYYNDPHDINEAPIKRELFQYYDPVYLTKRDGRWFFRGNRLNVVASVDFAYTTGKLSDYSAIVVVGADSSNNYYILDIDRFKTDKHSEYFKHILKMYEKWGFRKLRAEVTAAQKVMVKDLKESYIRPYGLGLSIEEYSPTRWQGVKEERIMATLEPRYANLQMWHYPGGHTQALEEELMFANPAHDDIKDALASAVDFAIAPSSGFAIKKFETANFQFHTKFGGVV